MKDPTKEEMLDALSIFSDITEEDIEEAIFWFSTHYYKGQSSNLYKALCASFWHPGPLNDDVEGIGAKLAYNTLLDAFKE